MSIILKLLGLLKLPIFTSDFSPFSPDVRLLNDALFIFVTSSALGSSVNSTSSLFVASDGVNMRLYQAVIDARGLLSADTNQNYRHRVSLCLWDI